MSDVYVFQQNNQASEQKQAVNWYKHEKFGQVQIVNCFYELLFVNLAWK